jgi:mannose-1-phosphate guanylyltransferase
MLHAVIMAGGSGTRFWPASRATTPKQLLNLVGGETMIRQTVDRLQGLVGPEQTLIVTNRRLVDTIQAQLPELPPTSIVGEPCKRDTAPCIGLAALLVRREDPDAVMAVMPADHVISPTEKFQAALTQAVAMVAEQPARIVTFGIKPSYPAEIFGYIQRGRSRLSNDGAPNYSVEKFREKPDAATAAEYLDSGDYYWNSGIFVWRATTILDAIAKRQPAMLAHLETIVAAWGSEEQAQTFETEFTAIEGISVDYAVMEHATDVAVVEAPYNWDDLGGWQSLARLRGTDDDGNTIVGKHLGFNTNGTIVRSDEQHLIVTLGLQDCIVVHTENATLVANKNDEESIRKVVKELESRGWSEYL